MKRIVITSNKYAFCLEGFQTLLARHWKDPDAEYTVVGFKDPNVKFHDNITFESLGEHFNDASRWTDTLTPYISKLEDEYFFLAFEDHFLVGDVNLDIIRKAEEIMTNDKTVGKVRLLPKYLNDTLVDYNDDFYRGLTRPNSYVLTSLRPAIWRKSTFLRLLHHPLGVKNPYDFEVFNNRINFHDETVIIPKGKNPVYPDIDAMRHGKPNPQANKAGVVNMNFYQQPIPAEDIPVFKETNKKWRNRKHG